MHSDLTQAERDEMMFKFKSGEIDVLVATDIISRGIDIDDISMVINYDTPHETEDYIHRIGRTARANKDGQAITFVNGNDIPYFMKIEKFLEKDIEKIPIPQALGKGPEYKMNGNNFDGRRNYRKGGSHSRNNRNKSRNQGRNNDRNNGGNKK